jgi:hypothetical protein
MTRKALEHGHVGITEEIWAKRNLQFGDAGTGGMGEMTSSRLA